MECDTLEDTEMLQRNNMIPEEDYDAVEEGKSANISDNKNINGMMRSN